MRATDLRKIRIPATTADQLPRAALQLSLGWSTMSTALRALIPHCRVHFRLALVCAVGAFATSCASADSGDDRVNADAAAADGRFEDDGPTSATTDSPSSADAPHASLRDAAIYQCAEVSHTSCDDGNDCTIDHLLADCTCTHEPVADQTPCDDDDVCTEAEQCAAGVCRGRPHTSSARITGTVHSFAGVPGLRTAAAVVSSGRAVFLSNYALTLVSLDSARESLRPLDRYETGMPVTSQSISAQIWGERPGTFLLPMGGGRVAAVARGWGIDLYDGSGDRLTPLQRYGFAPLESDIRGAAARGDRVWTCAGTTVRAYAVDPITAAITAAGATVLPAGHSCTALSVGPQGEPLFVATLGGLDVLDVRDRTVPPQWRATAAPGQRLIDVSAGADVVAIYELGDLTGGAGAVTVFDENAGVQLARFAANNDGSGPIGVVAVSGGVLIQRVRQDSCLRYSAELHARTGAKLAATSTWDTLTACHPASFSWPVRVAGGDGFVVLEPFHQIVSVDARQGTVRPLAGAGHGSLERVTWPRDGHVAAFGPASWNDVSLSSDGVPSLHAGVVLPPQTEWLRMGIGLNGAIALLTVPGALAPAVGPVTSLIWERGAQAPAVTGTLRNDDPDSAWVTAAGLLFQLTRIVDPEPGLRLRSFTFSRDGADSGMLGAAADQMLAWDPALLVNADDVRLVVDEATLDAIVIVASGSGQDDEATTVARFGANGAAYNGPPTVVREPGRALDAAAALGRTVLLYANRLALRDVSGAALSVSAGDFPDVLSFDRIVQLDSGRLLVTAALSSSSTMARGRWTVLELDTARLREAARYETTEPVRTVTRARNRFVFGMDETLTVADPACPTPRPSQP